ncbi:hypothetical protein FACS1894191_2590 [Clostridia bacterium]|nr:hypothetical protein FACS1894191_2590 [Clostridia bacterium]
MPDNQRKRLFKARGYPPAAGIGKPDKRARCFRFRAAVLGGTLRRARAVFILRGFPCAGKTGDAFRYAFLLRV